LFSPEEYKQLHTATGERARNPLNERWPSACEDLHDLVLFVANSGLCPDEAPRIQAREVEIVADGPKLDKILYIVVRGKRRAGYVKTVPRAVLPFTRVVERHKRTSSDLILPTIQRVLFNTILGELDLKRVREGNARATYSLRHTYICLRLMKGANIYHIAKNSRTGVEMIKKNYISHIKNMLNASVINIICSKARR
jgi:hypothetical protein